LIMSGLAKLQLQDLNLWSSRWKAYLWKLSPDWEICRRGWNIHWFMPYSCDTGFVIASVLSKIYTKTLAWWSVTAPVFHLWKYAPNDITSDRICVCGYDIETRQQSSHWKSPARQVCSLVS
jgi:hypothetical protein